MNQSLTPEQQKQVKKAKATLWVGIIAIIVIGLLITVYFVFLKEGAVNSNANTNTVIDTSNWNTYINTQYGFQFKYSGDWQMRENVDGNIVSLSHQNNYYIYITLQGKNPEGLTIKEWLRQVKGQSEDFGYELKYDKETGITLEGLEPGIYQGAVTLYFINGNDVFGIEWFDNDKKNEEVFKIFNQILLSFEFIDTIDTTSWQTYEDKTNGYSIKYPADYLIKMQTDGYVVFDPKSIDTPDTTYLHISVTVEDNDFHTYRLGVLTDPSVQSDSVSEEDVTIDGLDGKKITLKNALGETIIHYIVNYLGKVYDISVGDSVDSEILNNVLASFRINQLADDVDIFDTNEFTGKACVSNNDCGAFPCYENKCLVKQCTSDSECLAGTCGQYATPVLGYCTTIDVL